MQKINKRASILIWAIFLSIIISIAFIGVSSKISKNLNKNLLSDTDSYVGDKISNKLKEKDFTSEVFENGEKIYFENNNFLKTGLKKDETIKLNFQTGSEILVKIYNGGPIFYSFINDELNTGSGIIKSIDTIVGVGTNLELTINNLGGYTSLSLSGSTDLSTDEKRYTITKRIGNKQIIKSSGFISNN